MSETQAIEIRSSRVAIRVAGKDAVHLLNDVLTGTIAEGDGPAHWWALLTPQGKILAEGLSAFAHGALWLDIDASVRENFLKRMRMYKLRADATVEDMGETHVVGWSERPVAAAVSHADSRGEMLGYRVIAPREDAADWTEGLSFLRRRIALGLAELGPDFAADSTFPHDIGMDLLGGIDFQKGCYVGQEVVSRMKHRGTARRRPAIVSGAGLSSEAPVMAGPREAGTLGAVLGDQAVAIVRLDRISDPATVTVGEQPATLALPSWASYRFGDSGGGGD